MYSSRRVVHHNGYQLHVSPVPRMPIGELIPQPFVIFPNRRITERYWRYDSNQVYGLYDASYMRTKVMYR